MSERPVDPHQLVSALFKKLDRIETKVDAAQASNSETYRMLAVLEQKTLANEARLKKLDAEAEAAEKHQVMCAEQRGKCPAGEFAAIKKMIWGSVISAVTAAVAAIVALSNSGGGK
jgi:hypothetical protein